MKRLMLFQTVSPEWGRGDAQILDSINIKLSTDFMFKGIYGTSCGSSRKEYDSQKRKQPSEVPHKWSFVQPNSSTSSLSVRKL